MSHRCPSCSSIAYTLIDCGSKFEKAICDTCNAEWIQESDVSTNDAGETLQSTDATLTQRGNRYGEFSGNAEVSCTLRDTLMHHYNSLNSEEMPLVQREAINLICHKLSRVVNGDVAYDDNWRDIAGYAELVVKELNKD